jgi:hypothetical protein
MDYEDISDDDSDRNAPDVLSDVYKSMSQVIENLNINNMLLNQQMTKLRNELDFICSAFLELKTENEILAKKIEECANIKKYATDTRIFLMQLLESNIKSLKKEINYHALP